MAGTGRKIIYFLGAGASYGAGAVANVQAGGTIPIPTQATFWDTFLRFCASQKNRSTIESFLFRYFLGYSKVPARVESARRRHMLRSVDVEEVFTFLSERARAPASSPALRTYAEKVWGALLAEFGSVFGRFHPTGETKRTFRALQRNYIKSHDVVVSFNYDTIFEQSIRAGRWHYEQVSTKSPGLRILKPHGSINWQDGETIVQTANPDRCVVVAPTHLKFVQTGEAVATDTIGYLDRSKQINQIWYRMEQEMRRAKALVFIGYSFPVADLYFSSVLRSVLADRRSAPGVVIVNPDAVSIRDRLVSRFPLERVILRYDLKNFVQAKRAQLQRELDEE